MSHDHAKIPVFVGLFDRFDLPRGTRVMALPEDGPRRSAILADLDDGTEILFKFKGHVLHGIVELAALEDDEIERLEQNDLDSST